ncbi:MAG: serine/threonine-protein kinase [Planctomycetota bacterium]|nr:serine/threonine-protein kinase [Planctomycetota bacterium]
MQIRPDSEHQPDSKSLLARFQSIIAKDVLDYHAIRKLTRRLGGGGQGVVFLSERRGADGFSLPVALKLFSPEPYTSSKKYEREMQRIARVASAVAEIQHDNLIDVQNFINFDGIHGMEMEWVDGYDLRGLLTPDALEHVREHASEHCWEKLTQQVVTEGTVQPRVKPGLAIAIIRECLRGLSALHRGRIVHNDLKPSNIMLKRSGNVKLIDIGSAFSLDDVPLDNPCTPQYAAPEVLRGSEGTPQSDLASIGYVLLEMLSGTTPFSGLKYTPMLKAKYAILEEFPKYLPSEEFAYSDLLIPLLRRFVAPDPRNRFSTAEEADRADDGAAQFEKELVKGDMSSPYESDIREWMLEVDSGLSPAHQSHKLDSTCWFTDSRVSA